MVTPFAFVSFSALLFLYYFPGSEALQCPKGWTLYQESCYVLVQKYLDWFESKVACDVLGGNLAEINNADENHFAANLLATHSAGFHSPLHPTITRAWIGLFDFLVERDYLWATTRSEPVYTHWSPGEPNNADDEDCGELYPNGFWNDERCRDETWFLCESPALEDGSLIG